MSDTIIDIIRALACWPVAAVLIAVVLSRRTR